MILPEASSSLPPPIRKRVLRSPRSLQDDENVAFADRVSLGAADLLHGAVVLGLHGDLHLHRLEDDDGVAILDLVADGNLDFPDVAGDVRRDLGAHASLTRGRISAHDGGAAESAVRATEGSDR